MINAVKKHRILTLIYLILLTISIVSMTILNMRVASIFQAAQSKDYVLLLRLFLILFVFYIVTRLIDYLAETTSFYLINRIREDIKNNLFKKYIQQSMENYSVRDAGRYVSDFTNDVTMIENKALNSYKELIKSLLSIVAGNIAILTIDYRMNIVIIIGIAICLLIPSILVKKTTVPMNKFIVSFEFFVQQLKDYFGAFLVVKNFAAEDMFYKKFCEKNKDVEHLKLDAEITIDFVNSLIGRIAWFIEFAVISVGVIEVVGGTMEISVLFSAYLLTGEICMPLQSISGYINNIKSVSGIMKKSKSISISKKSDAATRSLVAIKDTLVRFDHFSLTRDGSKVLDDICLSFKPNGKYLILGHNGSGKSTLAKSMKKVFTNYEGCLYFNDTELKDIPDEHFNKLVIYSNETVALFSDTVLNNITLYQHTSEVVLKKALEASRFNIPLDYVLTERGRNISSGEKRKLELSRVMIADTPIIVFDEVISTLDIETAYEIEKLILSLNKTVIMISNAFSGSLLEQYDEIVLIDHGHIVDHGNHEYMMKCCEKYRELYHIRCEL